MAQRFRMRSKPEIKAILEQTFRAEFPNDTVDISDGYQNNIHVLVVSRRFDAMTEKDMQDALWRIIDGTDLPMPKRRRSALSCRSARRK